MAKRGTQIDYRLLYLVQDGRCFYCGVAVPPQRAKNHSHTAGWTKDHFHPRSEGNHLPGNVVLACGPCNHGKEDHVPDEAERTRFAQLMQRYHEIRARESVQETPGFTRGPVGRRRKGAAPAEAVPAHGPNSLSDTPAKLAGPPGPALSRRA